MAPMAPARTTTDRRVERRSTSSPQAGAPLSRKGGLGRQTADLPGLHLSLQRGACQ
jgi:hypothetical protein